MIINGKNVKLIAEVKVRSPFGFESPEPWDRLFDLAYEVGDIIGVHTGKGYEGSFELLKRAKERVKKEMIINRKPLLAKGTHATDYEVKRALEFADYALVIGRIPVKEYLDRCLIEPISLEGLSKIPENCMVVWNSRDLKTGELKKETFEQAREIWKGWLCQASNIHTIDDVKSGANAILVGTYLRQFAKSAGLDV